MTYKRSRTHVHPQARRVSGSDASTVDSVGGENFATKYCLAWKFLQCSRVSSEFDSSDYRRTLPCEVTVSVSEKPKLIQTESASLPRYWWCRKKNCFQNYLVHIKLYSQTAGWCYMIPSRWWLGIDYNYQVWIWWAAATTAQRRRKGGGDLS